MDKDCCCTLGRIRKQKQALQHRLVAVVYGIYMFSFDWVLVLPEVFLRSRSKTADFGAKTMIESSWLVPIHYEIEKGFLYTELPQSCVDGLCGV